MFSPLQLFLLYHTLIPISLSETLRYRLVDGVEILPVEALHEFHGERVFSFKWAIEDYGWHLLKTGYLRSGHSPLSYMKLVPSLVSGVDYEGL